MKILRSAFQVATGAAIFATAAAFSFAPSSVLRVFHSPVFAAEDKALASAAGESTVATPPSSDGAMVYGAKCAVCHGEKLQGIPPSFPSLAGVGKQMNDQQIADLVHHGRGRMPAFSNAQLTSPELASLLHYLAANPTFTMPVTAAASSIHGADVVDAGGSIFQQNCAFCHGRDAAGGESGPDLTRSKLVAEDVKGDKIAVVVRNGKPDNKMPKFNFTEVETADLVKFIHAQAALTASRPGGRRGVDVADLQTGNVEAGKEYFEGPGGCSSCHSATGDLAGVASKYQGLQLEEQMLYPRDAKDKVTVTLPSGGTVQGTLAYQDEFTVGLIDGSGTYRSWPVGSMQYKIDAPEDAHVALFSKYTDDDIHNLMAYIQTMK